MGARQVPRTALQVAAALALLLGGRAPVHARPARPVVVPPTSSEPSLAVVIDARTDAATLAAERAALVRTLGAEGVRVMEPAAPPVDPAATSLALAAQRFGELDCAGADAAAADVIGALGQRLAATGVTDALRADLRRAWTYRFLCGERAAAPAVMQRAAGALRNLGVRDGAEVGITATSWAQVPAVDASTDREIVELTVQLDQAGTRAPLPPGSALWLDHAALAPSSDGRWFVPAGVHGVAVRVAGAEIGKPALPTGGAVVDILIDDKHREVVVPVGPVTSPGPSPAALALTSAVAAAASPEATLDTRRAAALLAMDATGATRAVLLRSTSSVEVWRRDEGGAITKVATTPLAASMIAAALRDLDAPPPPPVDQRPVIGERPSRARWWVYATLAGAIAVSTTVLLVAGGGDDVQRIEVRGP
jgi:hypothetical protein